MNFWIYVIIVYIYFLYNIKKIENIDKSQSSKIFIYFYIISFNVFNKTESENIS